jgi:hypothetical protein
MKGVELELKKLKPTFYLSEKDLKDIKKWMVGESYTIELEVIMKMKKEDEDMVEGDFEIKKAKSIS